nr:hypothetical protein [Haloarcula sp. 1CSR25-25]
MTESHANRFMTPYFLKESEEFLELGRRELRGATAREARSKSIETRIIPRGEPSITSITGDANTSSGYFCRITEIEVLHETEPPDETSLIRFLGGIERFVELVFRQMPRHFFSTTCHHCS